MSSEMTEQEKNELAEIKQKIADRKAELQVTSTTLPSNDTNIMEVVKNEENELLKSNDFSKISKRVGEERIKADLSAEASRIRSKNIETAENEFANETRELKLTHLKEELKLQHKYNMDTLQKDEKHRQMLSKRKKLVEKYSYLYDCREENCFTAYDDKGQPYLVPKDFSYSSAVNRIRQFGRNISKLDRPIIQTLKWILICGVGIGIYFILKKLGIIV